MEQNSIKLVNRVCLAIALISLFGSSILLPFYKNQYLITILAEGIVLIPTVFKFVVKHSWPTPKETVFTGIGLIAGILLPLYLNTQQMSMLIGQSLLLLPAILFIIYKGESLFHYIRVKKVGIITVILVVVFTYAMFPVIGLLNMISMLFATNVIEASINNVVGDSITKGLFLIALVPAFVEEVVYRGVIYHTYKKANPRKAIFFSALLFGAMHMNFNQFVYAFALGLVMALLIEATGSILPAMLMHFLVNGTSIVSGVLLGSDGPSVSAMAKEEILDMVIDMLPTAMTFLVIAISVLCMIAKRNSRFDHLKRIVSGEQTGAGHRIVTVGMVVTLILCLLMALAMEVFSRGLLY